MKIANMAFTLAEVLITLAILGVVVAVTIPAVMTSIQDNEFKNAAKEAYSKVSQSVQQMTRDEGGSLNDYMTTGYSFKPIFMNYFKVIKDCNMEDCVPHVSSNYKTLKGLLATTFLIDDGQFITADGIFYCIENDNTHPNFLFITVDVNGYIKGPNTYGRDVFIFQIENSGQLLPMGAAGTQYPADTYCSRSSNSDLNGFGCMSLVMNGINY